MRTGPQVNLLFLSKRFPQGRDLLRRPYGRFYHLPRLLAQRGHRVHVALLSHKRLPADTARFEGIDWSSDDLLPSGPAPYLRRVYGLLRTLQPHWVIGCSDTYYGILAQRAANRSGARSAIDAYDDFEAYIPWARPLHWLWRRALAGADLVTAPGPQLAAHLGVKRAAAAEILPMAADPAFQPLARANCRRRLGLPADRKLVGHLGAFDPVRGRSVVLEAIAALRREHPDLSLVLSGRRSGEFHDPPGVISTGYVIDELMPALVNSLDVACVALADNRFGRASYPVKLCEAMACQVPVVASATEPVRWMLQGDSRFLAAVGSADDMARKISANLGTGRIDYGARPSWDTVAKKLESLLLSPASRP